MKLAVIALALLIGNKTFASIDSKYFEIKNVVVRESTQTFSTRNDVAIGSIDCDSFQPNAISTDTESFTGPLDTVDMIVDKIINIGRKLWAIVQAGQPILNIKTSVATALPQNARCWTDLAGWQMPESRVYDVGFENGFGSEVVTLSYRVIWLPGGNVAGQGKYVGYATVAPASVAVSWGFSLDAEVTIPTVFNMGSQKAPIGAMQVNVGYRVKSPVTVIDEGQAFFINGEGHYKMLD